MSQTTKWEYLTGEAEYFDDAWSIKIKNGSKTLNQLGKDGWELVTVSPTDDSWIFKRPLP